VIVTSVSLCTLVHLTRPFGIRLHLNVFSCHLVSNCRYAFRFRLIRQIPSSTSIKQIFGSIRDIEWCSACPSEVLVRLLEVEFSCVEPSSSTGLFVSCIRTARIYHTRLTISHHYIILEPVRRLRFIFGLTEWISRVN